MTKVKTLEAGSEVEAMCKKCKAPTAHVIEVVKNDEIKKVMCKSCFSSHRYISPLEAEQEEIKKAAVKKATSKTTKTKKSSTSSAKVTKTKEEKKWSRLLSKLDSDNPKEYDMGGSFEEKSVISHKIFGIGVVVEVLDPRKMSVAFQDGIKTMVMNR